MSKDFLDRNLALEAVRVTEAAALSSSLHMGRGNEKIADQAAVNAMRGFLKPQSLNFSSVSCNAVRMFSVVTYLHASISDLCVDRCMHRNGPLTNIVAT